MQDVAVGACRGTDKGDTADNWVGGEAGDDRLLDVESVLRENNRGDAWCHCGLNDVGYCWRDVGNVLGCH